MAAQHLSDPVKSHHFPHLQNHMFFLKDYTPTCHHFPHLQNHMFFLKDYTPTCFFSKITHLHVFSQRLHTYMFFLKDYTPTCFFSKIYKTTCFFSKIYKPTCFDNKLGESGHFPILYIYIWQGNTASVQEWWARWTVCALK